MVVINEKRVTNQGHHHTMILLDIPYTNTITSYIHCHGLTKSIDRRVRLGIITRKYDSHRAINKDRRTPLGSLMAYIISAHTNEWAIEQQPTMAAMAAMVKGQPNDATIRRRVTKMKMLLYTNGRYNR
jgi:hypothetical protein